MKIPSTCGRKTPHRISHWLDTTKIGGLSEWTCISEGVLVFFWVPQNDVCHELEGNIGLLGKQHFFWHRKTQPFGGAIWYFMSKLPITMRHPQVGLYSLIHPPSHYPGGVVAPHFVRGPTPHPTKWLFASLQNGTAAQTPYKMAVPSPPLAWPNFARILSTYFLNPPSH